jgi:hypothetical protein
MWDEDVAEEFGQHIKEKLNNIEPPEGIKINKWKYFDDPLVFPLLDDLMTKNLPRPSEYMHTEKILIGFNIESEDDLLFKKLDWLEQSIKDTVSSFKEGICAIVSFLHYNEGKDIQVIGKAKVFDNDELDSYMTQEYLDADYSPILQYTELLMDHFYTDNEPFVDSDSPHIAAKFLLKYGEPDLREEIE